MQKKVIWLFGLSGTGKSTIARSIITQLKSKKFNCLHLDGDELRTTINKDLGYTDKDRKENIRRAAELSKLLSTQNFICVCSFITPFKELRSLVRDVLSDSVELFFINTPIEECIKRDVKGLYKKAKNNEIPNFTGISANFEYPDESENVIKINTLNKTPDECAAEVLKKITQ